MQKNITFNPRPCHSPSSMVYRCDGSVKESAAYARREAWNARDHKVDVTGHRAGDQPVVLAVVMHIPPGERIDADDVQPGGASVVADPACGAVCPREEVQERGASAAGA